MIVAVTGHRPEKLGGHRTPNDTYRRVMEGMDKALLELRPEYVITGMAQGVDQWMAELCYWNGIPFLAAIPFAGFESHWPMPAQMHFRQLLAKASRTHIVCPGEYSAWKMQQRNMWMVDNCHHLIAVWDGSTGGTKNCVEYAQSQRRNIWRVPLIAPPTQPATRPAPPPVEVRPASRVLREIAIPVREIPRSLRAVRNALESEGMRAARRVAAEAQAAELRRQEQAEEREAIRQRRERERQETLAQARAVLLAAGRGEVENVEISPEETILQLLEDSITATRRAARPAARPAPTPPPAPKKAQKEEGPAIREFTRVLDLD